MTQPRTVVYHLMFQQDSRHTLTAAAGSREHSFQLSSLSKSFVFGLSVRHSNGVQNSNSQLKGMVAKYANNYYCWSWKISQPSPSANVKSFPWGSIKVFFNQEKHFFPLCIQRLIRRVSIFTLCFSLSCGPFFPLPPHISSSTVQQRNFVLVQTTEREISF